MVFRVEARVFRFVFLPGRGLDVLGWWLASPFVEECSPIVIMFPCSQSILVRLSTQSAQLAPGWRIEKIEHAIFTPRSKGPIRQIM